MENLNNPNKQSAGLEACLRGATWRKLGGAGGNLGRAIFGFLSTEAAFLYAKGYLEEHDQLPEGPHVVSFTYGPEGTADIVCAWGKEKVDEEITFPSLVLQG